MTLIVETGAGLAMAESYVSVTDCAAYATLRGLTFPATPEAAAEQALRRATTWIDARYRGVFPGQRKNGRDQALQWPRINAWDNSYPPEPIASDEIPDEIVKATCEAAVRELASPSSLTPDVTEKLKSVGNIEFFANGSAVDEIPTVNIIDDILAGLLDLQRGPALFGRTERA